MCFNQNNLVLWKLKSFTRSIIADVLCITKVSMSLLPHIPVWYIFQNLNFDKCDYVFFLFDTFVCNCLLNAYEKVYAKCKCYTHWTYTIFTRYKL